MPKSVLQLRKWGESRAIVIPAHIVRQMNWPVGQIMQIVVEDDRVSFIKVDLPQPRARAAASEAVTDGDKLAG